jgi:hypothetical protein
VTSGLNAGNPFGIDGQWYRGNLHMHSTNSDGARSPAEAIAWYRDAGYDFAVLSDHRIVSDTSTFSTPDFLTIPGIEMHGPDPYTGERYHLLAVGVQDLSRSDDAWGIQEAIDRVNEAQGIAVMAHPYWLGQSAFDMRKLHGFVGMEVFNSTCDLTHGKGFSNVTWDEYLLHYGRTWGFATDDAHWKHGDEGRGWVVVRTNDKTTTGIISALRQGHFYASMGPDIKDITIDDGVVHVHTSPASRISIIADRAKGRSYHATSDQLTNISHTLRGTEHYVRVEVADKHGCYAWANPIMLSKQ